MMIYEGVLKFSNQLKKKLPFLFFIYFFKICYCLEGFKKFEKRYAKCVNCKMNM